MGKRTPRVVNVESTTPSLYRGFCQLVISNRWANKTSNGFLVLNETKWASALSAFETKEIA